MRAWDLYFLIKNVQNTKLPSYWLKHQISTCVNCWVIRVWNIAFYTDESKKQEEKKQWTKCEQK